MGFSGLGTAISGLRAAQVGLAVTGHNMSNSEISGYSRQRVIQRDSFYNSVGNAADGTPLRRGLGTDWNAISQIRNEFLDFSYRQSNSRLSFYSVKTTVGAEIEALMGELQGSDNFQSIIQDMWYSIQELTAHPQGVETRDYFLATCSSFVTKANEVYDSLFKYQINLDGQIREAVDDVNDTVTRIKELNLMIETAEVSGDNANDYRDERNLCLDRLSELINISYSYNNKGHVNIFSEGHMILSNNIQNFMGLRFTSDDYSFVEPILTAVKKDEILSSRVPPTDFEQYINYDKPVTADRNNDYGVLKGLIISRGAMPAYYLGKEGLIVPVGPPMQVALAPGSPPDETDAVKYPGGVTDPQYITDLAKWEEYDAYPDELKNIIPPKIPDANDTSLYPLGEDDPAYKTAMDNYNLAYGSYLQKTVTPVAEYLKDSEKNGSTFYVTDPDAYREILKIQKGLARSYNAERYNYTMQSWSIDNCMIPKTMMKLDQVFHSIVTMINDTLAPATVDPDSPIGDGNSSWAPPVDPNNPQATDTRYQSDYAPYDNNGTQSYTEVFIRSAGPLTYMNRWYDHDGDPDTPAMLVPEEKGDYYTQYSIGNVEINPIFQQDEGGFNLLAFSNSGDIEDTQLLNELQKLWQSNTSDYAVEITGIKFNMSESYNKFVSQIATEVAEAKSFIDAQTVQVERAENKRQSIMGVSMDEEMNNMMKYQYAYQAAARILNVIDSMIDRVVNQTGRAGL